MAEKQAQGQAQGPKATPKPKRSRKRKVAFFAVAALVFVILFWFGTLVLLFYAAENEWVFVEFSNLGTLGDSFGLFTSLFSGLTLVAALTAVYFQHLGLEDERRKARAERRRQKQEDEERRREERLREDERKRRDSERAEDRIADRFYHLLDSLPSLIVETDAVSSSTPNMSLQEITARFESRLASLTEVVKEKGEPKELKAELSSVFLVWFGGTAKPLSRWTTRLHVIVSMIGRSSALSHDEKAYYLQHVRTSLSDSELLMWCIWCSYGTGPTGIRDILDDFGFFDSLYVSHRLWIEHFYPRTAERVNTKTQRFLSDVKRLL